MATLLASAVISRASILLQDVTNIRWPLSEMIDWLNDGQREVALYKPNACVRNVDFVLAAGAKQTLPSDGSSLVDIPRNTGGGAIRIVAREILDTQLPDWSTAANAKAKVIHYCYNERDPKTFYVFPPATGGASVELVYNASPPPAALGSVISVDDVYVSALVDYIAYRAYSKDTEYATNNQNAVAHYNAFLTSIKGKAVGEAETDPNAHAPGNPNISRK